MCHYEGMKHKAECTEGPEAFARFDAAIGKVLTVSHAELMRREAEYQRKAKQNPHKRGPKPKPQHS